MPSRRRGYGTGDNGEMRHGRLGPQLACLPLRFGTGVELQAVAVPFFRSRQLRINEGLPARTKPRDTTRSRQALERVVVTTVDPEPPLLS
jgi:hypothetical protein